ncbi:MULTISPECIES: oxaloacetate decarboxylase subunit gamma [Corallincola]|uniref:Probable oxaloacetate decarboxylase gamma chain n=3 Tax=Corallincola TaxID=1775176 RepID=A0A368NPV3_9GAMM|nr:MULTISPECIES: oxaloacetate decarboxylase subunit gamma [Corallincola]RCU51885.1 oxaloacetate decarboxylase subunit gamma [Corallincola holothuriorum]TAA47375.1 oxaloacetate decarboxylase subunit gamma [Corallincola spongiicola]TCI05048.1 oxaloacetate decarboxylase subunit gamma [Corallincola luteus]
MTSISELLLEAAGIMAVGMIFVFLFLSLLVVGVKLLARFAGGPEPLTANATPPPQTTGVSPDVVAAISAAVHKYRNTTKD